MTLWIETPSIDQRGRYTGRQIPQHSAYEDEHNKKDSDENKEHRDEDIKQAIDDNGKAEREINETKKHAIVAAYIRLGDETLLLIYGYSLYSYPEVCLYS